MLTFKYQKPPVKANQSSIFCIDKEYFSSDQIVSLIADGNYSSIHLANGKVYISARTLKKYDLILSNLGFIRIHKSSIINPNYVVACPVPEVKLSNGQTLSVSRRKLSEVRRRFR